MTKSAKQVCENHLFNSLYALMNELEESFEQDCEFDMENEITQGIEQIEKELSMLKKSEAGEDSQ
ncbi:MAG: hypothetical protein JWM28_693 [Chitinophagaceae bacterium]|nr:hypothetical protein [Chitinophagaceae bacterium]